MLCQFSSRINEIASDIVYELYNWSDKYYLIKWNVGDKKFELKDKKVVSIKCLKKANM